MGFDRCKDAAVQQQVVWELLGSLDSLQPAHQLASLGLFLTLLPNSTFLILSILISILGGSGLRLDFL